MPLSKHCHDSAVEEEVIGSVTFLQRGPPIMVLGGATGERLYSLLEFIVRLSVELRPNVLRYTCRV